MTDATELWRGLDRAARHALPAAVIVVAIVLLALPGLLPAEAELRPGFVMASVFFWTLYRPAALPAPMVAVLGVLLGLLGDAPLGLWAVLLLLEQAMIGAVRKPLLRQGFLVVWTVFAGFAVVITGLEWACRVCLDLTLLSPSPIVLQGALAVLFYPLLAMPFARAHAGAAAPEQA